MKTINKNTLLSVTLTLALFLLTILLYDITFWLNDDVMLESLLSGTYTGTPEYMTFYFSVPLSFVISVLYRIIPSFPWFACFFILIYLLTFILITDRCLKISERYEKKKLSSKLIIMSFASLVYITVFMPSIVLLHYTILAAVTGAAGLFLLITVDNNNSEDTEKSLIKPLIIPVVLMLLCYMIRENVFFLLMPFFATAGIYRLIKEGTSSFGKYVKAVIIFVTLFILVFGINKLPYLSDTWKEYIEYNDERTTLYDFVSISDSPEALEYYHQSGIDDNTYDLYRSYNIMLADKNIDIIKAFSAYNDVKYSNRSLFKHFKDAAYVYVHSLFENKDFLPLNPVIFALYIIIFFAFLLLDKNQIITLLLLFASRTVAFLYLFWNDRYPVRVTRSLLYIELIFLLALLMEIASKSKYLALNKASVMITMVILLAGSYYTMTGYQTDYDTLSDSNSSDNTLYDCVMQDSDNMYIIDVFATVNRTHKAFDKSITPINSLVPGGWMTESPLTYKKLNQYNVSSAKELINNENTRLVLKENMYNGITIDNYEKWFNKTFIEAARIKTDKDTFIIYSADN